MAEKIDRNMEMRRLKAQGISQLQIAQRLGISPQRVSEILIGPAARIVIDRTTGAITQLRGIRPEQLKRAEEEAAAGHDNPA